MADFWDKVGQGLKDFGEWLFTPIWGNSDSGSSSSVSSAITTAQDLVADDRKFNADQAQLDRDFQERMSSTAYTRAIADLKNAGLNPYLAITNGGASSPSGSTASHVGLANTALSGLINNINTILRNQTSKDIARENNLFKLITKVIKIT